MHDHRPLDAQRGERPRHRLEQPLLGDAEQLHRRLGRVHAGAEDVHDRADAERAPHRPGMPEARDGKLGANRKQRPVSSSARRDVSGEASSLTPRCSSTSAEPQREVTERLPCLATGSPAAAATKATAVDRLIVPEPSPPVPQLSANR